ncbi:MAG: hypothetical protein AABZ06_02450, partial [Bdellovibrionota bacterium]
GRHRLFANSQILYDLMRQGTILSADIKYSLQSSWHVGVGADFLGSSRESESTVATDFIGRYKSNDRIRGGVTYVF